MDDNHSHVKVNKKPWTVEEDERLLQLVELRGSDWKWLKLFLFQRNNIIDI